VVKLTAKHTADWDKKLEFFPDRQGWTPTKWMTTWLPFGYMCLHNIAAKYIDTVAGGSRWRDGRWRGRAPGAALPSACGFPAVSIICRNGHCEMLSSGAHCPMTVPRVLVRRTASPEHADFGGLSSLDALVVVRLVVVPLPPRSPRRRWRVGRFGLIFCWT
jgi:hypothetical protein